MKGVNFKPLGGETKVVVNGVEKDINDLTKEEFLILNTQFFNETEGDLNIEDGINCDKCRNKGIVEYIENGTQFQKNCECMKKRLTFKRLNNCGISKGVLDKCTFNNYQTIEKWQSTIKENAIAYCKDIITENLKHWYYIGGKSGCGKTMICTAIFQNIIRRTNMYAYYMSWNEFVPKILALEKSAYDDNQAKYEKQLKEVQNADLLYIDDFLKLTSNKYNNDSISLAFKILDARYRNNKITIISSEYLPDDIDEIDTAILGRIYEKTNSGAYMINCGNDDSRNMRRRGKMV